MEEINILLNISLRRVSRGQEKSSLTPLFGSNIFPSLHISFLKKVYSNSQYFWSTQYMSSTVFNFHMNRLIEFSPDYAVTLLSSPFYR